MTSRFRRLLGDGRKWGVQFEYADQADPRELADAFLVGADFIGDDQVCLILGDNFFFGTGLRDQLREAAKLTENAHIFAYPVREPQNYGYEHGYLCRKSYQSKLDTSSCTI